MSDLFGEIVGAAIDYKTLPSGSSNGSSGGGGNNDGVALFFVAILMVAMVIGGICWGIGEVYDYFHKPKIEQVTTFTKPIVEKAKAKFSIGFLPAEEKPIKHKIAHKVGQYTKEVATDFGKGLIGK